MKVSDIIAAQILALLEQSEQGIAEIQRNELAGAIGCVPSQINYVLASRFTPEQGYLVESRRGGGGYIRITHVRLGRNATYMPLISTIGVSLDAYAAHAIVANLEHDGLVSRQTAALLRAALTGQCYRVLPGEYRDEMRAALFKQLLLSLD